MHCKTLKGTFLKFDIQPANSSLFRFQSVRDTYLVYKLLKPNFIVVDFLTENLNNSSALFPEKTISPIISDKKAVLKMIAEAYTHCEIKVIE